MKRYAGGFSIWIPRLVIYVRKETDSSISFSENYIYVLVCFEIQIWKHDIQFENDMEMDENSVSVGCCEQGGGEVDCNVYWYETRIIILYSIGHIME